MMRSMSNEPLLWPPHPRFVNAAERRVWEVLRDQLGPRDMVIANQHFVTRERDYELDLAVVIDGAGIVVIEVKGGRVWVEDGQWWQADGGPVGRHRVDPLEQALGNKHVLRNWVEESAAWHGRRPVRWAHAVALPDVEVERSVRLPEARREQILDASDLSEIGQRLRNLLDTLDTTRRPVSGDDAWAIHEALDARFVPHDLSVERLVERRDQEVERLSAEQAILLDAIALLARVEVRGGAGSGKTWLAVEQARRLARSGQRVALMCYSRGLAEWMRRRVETFDRRDRPAYVGTFHGVGHAWGTPTGTDDDSDFWEHRLPAATLELARRQPTAALYDAIVIDEAQDFADSWWPVALELLKYDDGGLFIFSDEGQRIFSRHGDAPPGLVPLLLERNLRNTRQISQTFTSMAPNTLRSSTADGLKVRFVAVPPEQALDAADDVVEELLDEGWQPSDVALLATGARHSEQRNRQATGWQAYWDSFWDDDQVFYGHVMGFKGLERPAVVLAINEEPNSERAKERLYVGLSRARDLLVVCGSEEHLSAVGGPAVLAKIRGS